MSSCLQVTAPLVFLLAGLSVLVLVWLGVCLPGHDFSLGWTGSHPRKVLGGEGGCSQAGLASVHLPNQQAWTLPSGSFPSCPSLCQVGDPVGGASRKVCENPGKTSPSL